MANGWDINDGPCNMCAAQAGEYCMDYCPEALRRPALPAEIDALRAKIHVLEHQVTQMIEPKNPKHRYFEMDEEMQAEANKWLQEHKKTCKVHQPGTNHGAIGGVLSYHFCSTSIGVLCSINCACGASSDCSGDL